MITVNLKDLKIRLKACVDRLDEKAKSIITDLSMAEAFLEELKIYKAQDEETEYLASQIDDLVDGIYSEWF